MSPPSRVLPQRSWAASIPTPLSHEAFDRLMMPAVLPGAARIAGNLMSPLERFFSCVFMRKCMLRVVQNEDSVSARCWASLGSIQMNFNSVPIATRNHSVNVPL